MNVDARTLRAIALQRTPGFNFPGHFLELAFDATGPDSARLSLDSGDWNTGRDGQVNVGPLALLADIALATSFRGAVGAGARLATVAMNVQLTGAPRTGRLEASTHFDGFVAGRAERQGLAHGEIVANGTRIATMQGSFMAMGDSNVTAAHPMPKRGDQRDVIAVETDLSDAERAVLAHARACTSPGEASFIERFWGYLPKAIDGGATCEAWNGPHVGNRVGHAQGGFTFGLAATTALAALPAGWALVGASAWYIGPGLGKTLTARSQVIHRGTLTGVVKTRIEDEAGRGVLEMVSSHAR